MPAEPVGGWLFPTWISPPTTLAASSKLRSKHTTSAPSITAASLASTAHPLRDRNCRLPDGRERDGVRIALVDKSEVDHLALAIFRLILVKAHVRARAPSARALDLDLPPS